MSITSVCLVLEELIDIHEVFLEFSKQKTSIIKDGTIEKFQKMLTDDQKHVTKLRQVEESRQIEVEKWFQQHHLPQTDMTVTNMLEHIPNEADRKILEELVVKLTQTITLLKQQEQLNNQLIRQSMQFVQLSLDMLNPTINNMNYGAGQTSPSTTRTMFDSKA